MLPVLLFFISPHCSSGAGKLFYNSLLFGVGENLLLYKESNTMLESTGISLMPKPFPMYLKGAKMSD